MNHVTRATPFSRMVVVWRLTLDVTYNHTKFDDSGFSRSRNISGRCEILECVTWPWPRPHARLLLPVLFVIKLSLRFQWCVTFIPNSRKIGQKLWSLLWTIGTSDRQTDWQTDRHTLKWFLPHGCMQCNARYCSHNSACPSATRVDCDKTKWCTVAILIPPERTTTL